MSDSVTTTEGIAPVTLTLTTAATLHRVPAGFDTEQGLYVCPLDQQTWAIVPTIVKAKPGRRVTNGPTSSTWVSDGPTVPLASEVRLTWDDELRNEFTRYVWPCGDHECYAETVPRPETTRCLACTGGYIKPPTPDMPSWVCGCCGGSGRHNAGGHTQTGGLTDPYCGADLS